MEPQAEAMRRVLVAVVVFCRYYCCVEGWGSPSPKIVAVPVLILFGDCTVDVGKNNFLNFMIRSDFLPCGCDSNTRSPTGRFTNGCMVVDYVGELYYLTLLVNFICFAIFSSFVA